MFKSITILILCIVFLSVVGTIIPDAFTQGMDTAIQSLVGYIYSLNTYINVSTLITCFEILFDFLVSAIMFITLAAVLRITAGK
jgi:hypothetical protein